MRRLMPVLLVIQVVLAIRVFARFAVTRTGRRVERNDRACNGCGGVTILVPVFNEIGRLGPCLDGLIGQGAEVDEILVIDGGSTDGTRGLIDQYAVRDRRIRLIDAAPVPAGVNGKAHGLQVGWEQSRATTRWVLTIDADVRPDAALVRSLLTHATVERVKALSAATLQRVSGPAEAMLHPSLLTTLVYRYGIPGGVATTPTEVQANGQCFLVTRDILTEIGGFTGVIDSVCEDVTLARAIAAKGHPVGFYETDHLVVAEMYGGWRDAWRNWTRSLPMRDRYSGVSTLLGLTEVSVVQAAPLWMTPLFARMLGRRHPATMLNASLIIARVGVLFGTGRAYEMRYWTYWLSPLCDLPVALKLWSMTWRQNHTWRGRRIVTGSSRVTAVRGGTER